MTTATAPSIAHVDLGISHGRSISLFRRLVQTHPDWSTTVLRLVLGVVMFPHGAQKVLGWFGGYGFSGTMQFFTHQAHIPALFAFLAIAAEFAGSLGLITGLFTRVAAFGIAVNMVVAILLVHQQVGFFMNWAGQYKAGQEGFEYALLAIGIAVYLMIKGGGAASADRAVSAKA